MFQHLVRINIAQVKVIFLRKVGNLNVETECCNSACFLGLISNRHHLVTGKSFQFYSGFIDARFFPNYRSN